MEELDQTYTAWCKSCTGWIYAVGDITKHCEDWMRDLGKLVKEGHEIKVLPLEEARALMGEQGACKCVA